MRLSSNNRQVIVTNEATVTIVDGDGSDVEATSTTEPAISTTVSTTTTSVPTSIIPTGKFHLSCAYYSLNSRGPESVLYALHLGEDNSTVLG